MEEKVIEMENIKKLRGQIMLFNSGSGWDGDSQLLKFLIKEQLYLEVQQLIVKRGG